MKEVASQRQLMTTTTGFSADEMQNHASCRSGAPPQQTADALPV